MKYPVSRLLFNNFHPNEITQSEHAGNIRPDKSLHIDLQHNQYFWVHPNQFHGFSNSQDRKSPSSQRLVNDPTSGGELFFACSPNGFEPIHNNISIFSYIIGDTFECSIQIHWNTIHTDAFFQYLYNAGNILVSNLLINGICHFIIFSVRVLHRGIPR